MTPEHHAGYGQSLVMGTIQPVVGHFKCPYTLCPFSLQYPTPRHGDTDTPLCLQAYIQYRMWDDGPAGFAPPWSFYEQWLYAGEQSGSQSWNA
jgi:hypothetical protein